MFRRFRTRVLPDRLLVVDTVRRVLHRPSPRDLERLLDGDREAQLGLLGEEAVAAALVALERPAVDRRGLLRSTSLAGTTGIVSVVLPCAAAASSVDGVATGVGFTTSVTFTETDSTGGVLGTFAPSAATGSSVQVVAEGAAGATAVSGGHAPGRGRRVGVNLDRAALVTLTTSLGVAALEIRSSANVNGTTITGGGGDGGQGVALLAGSVALVVAGGGGGAGLDGDGGDADAAAATFTNASGGTLTGGSPPSDGTGGGAGVASGAWFSTGSGEPGRSSPANGTPARGGIDNQGNGAGGGGFGGGGSGGFGTVRLEDSSTVVRATGGGGGGSYVDATNRVGTATLGHSARTALQRCALTIFYDP